MRYGSMIVLGLLSPLLGGCFAPVVAGLTLNQLSTVASVISIAATGKGPSEHALSVVADGDCRVLDGLLREDRDICEAHGSAATKQDFRGLASLLEPDPAEYPAWLASLNGQDSAILPGLFGPPIDIQSEGGGIVHMTFADLRRDGVCETRFDIGPTGHIVYGSFQGEGCQVPASGVRHL